jgi:hypothetical protein
VKDDHAYVICVRHARDDTIFVVLGDGGRWKDRRRIATRSTPSTRSIEEERYRKLYRQQHRSDADLGLAMADANG